MKSFIETSPGIITFRALPYPLPAHTQELLKASGAHLAALNDAIEKAASKSAKKKQSTSTTLLFSISNSKKNYCGRTSASK